MYMNLPYGYEVLAMVQEQTGWKTVTGAGIGGTPPKDFTLSQTVPWIKSAMELSIEGIPGNWCDALASFSQPFTMKLQGTVMQTAVFVLSKGYASMCQALEFDQKPTDASGFTYHGDTQWDYSLSATEMTFCVWNNGAWFKTNLVLPKFSEEIKHSQTVELAYDTVKRCSTVSAVMVDGVVYAINAPLNVPATNEKWGPSQLTDQVQLDVNTLGGSYQMLLLELLHAAW